MSSVTTQDTTTTSALVTRVRSQFATVSARWAGLPERLRAAWDELRSRLRSALELPTRDELSRLTNRLDELDAKIAGLFAARTELHASHATAEKRSRKK